MSLLEKIRKLGELEGIKNSNLVFEIAEFVLDEHKDHGSYDLTLKYNPNKDTIDVIYLKCTASEIVDTDQCSHNYSELPSDALRSIIYMEGLDETDLTRRERKRLVKDKERGANLLRRINEVSELFDIDKSKLITEEVYHFLRKHKDHGNYEMKLFYYPHKEFIEEVGLRCDALNLFDARQCIHNNPLIPLPFSHFSIIYLKYDYKTLDLELQKLAREENNWSKILKYERDFYGTKK